MFTVKVKNGDLQLALREYRRQVIQSGLLREIKVRRWYVTPSQARKIKSIRARRRKTR